MSESNFYFNLLAAAFVRGKLQENPEWLLGRESLFQSPLMGLTSFETDALIQLGLTASLRLHKFKRTMELARVQKVLGILKGMAPTELLDVGSGRGTFLWPCLDAFPGLAVTAIDQDERRVTDIQSVHAGGIENLVAQRMDVQNLSFPDQSFDVVTMLEVLEHMPDPQSAITEGVRVAKRFVVVSVPSKPDDNPDHLHLFSADQLRRMLEIAGTVRVRFESVLNHLIAVAKVTP